MHKYNIHRYKMCCNYGNNSVFSTTTGGKIWLISKQLQSEPNGWFREFLEFYNVITRVRISRNIAFC